MAIGLHCGEGAHLSRNRHVHLMGDKPDVAKLSVSAFLNAKKPELRGFVMG